jgi:hypothetical protein
LGNLIQQPLDDTWKGVKDIQQGVITGYLHPACNSLSCPYYALEKRIHKDIEEFAGPVELEIRLPMQNCDVGGMRPTEERRPCFGCERDWNYQWQEDRLFEICTKIKPLMPNIQYLSVQGVAEPFCQDAIFNVFRWLGAQDYKKQLLIHTATAGMLLRPVVRYRYLWYDNSFLMVSLPAGTAETFEKICRVNMFDTVVENVREYSKERNPKTQKLALHSHINMLNIGEVETLVQIAADLKVDFIEFDASYAMPGLVVDATNVGQFRDAQKKIVAKGRELGVQTTFLRNLYLTLGPGQ